MIQVLSLDHLVLTVADVDATVAFYTKIGFSVEIFGEGRKALKFGSQKLNLHQLGAEVKPNARAATPGSADLCFLVSTPIDQVVLELQGAGIAIELGPVDRTGAVSGLRSVYFRDPDGNLIEFSNSQ